MLGRITFAGMRLRTFASPGRDAETPGRFPSADHAFARRDAGSTLPTLPATNQLVIPGGTCVDHTKLPVPASPAPKTTPAHHFGILDFCIAHICPCKLVEKKPRGRVPCAPTGVLPPRAPLHYNCGLVPRSSVAPDAT